MASCDCQLCNMTMDFPTWDEHSVSDSGSLSRLKEEVLFSSPLSDAEATPSGGKGEGSLLEFDLSGHSIDQINDTTDSCQVVYDVDSGTAHCPTGTSAQSTSGNSVYSSESGFCSENTVNLHCSESAEWWSDEAIVQLDDDAKCTPISRFTPSPRSDEKSQIAGFEEYKSEIYHHRKELEHRRHVKECLKDQKEITPGIRAVLISWLSKVHHEFQLSHETLFLTVNIVDRCLKCMHVSRECFQLVGATALLIAGKHEEVTPPEIQDLLWICGDTYTRDQMIELEKIMLETLHFEIFVPTGSFFLEYYAYSEMTMKNRRFEDGFRNARRQARYFLELALQEYELCQYPPSMLALCAWRSGVRNCLSQYENYPSWEMDFPSTVYEKCYADFTVFTAQLTHSFPEAKVLSEKFAYEDVEDSDCE